MTESITRDRTMIMCVVLVCITAIVCCWLLRPARYEVVESASTATKLSDRQSGEIVTPKWK